MKRIKKSLAVLLSVVMVFGILPFAVNAESTVSYIDANGITQTAENVTVVDDYTYEFESGWYAVTSDVTINYRITCSGEVNLILADGCTLTASKGISVNAKNSDNEDISLTVYGQQTGSGTIEAFNVTTSCAAIGSDDSNDSGLITINGGTFDVVGGSSGAGIGGGYNGKGYVTVNRGTITAEGGSSAAGIGGGNKRFGYDDINGYVTINGGRITASGGNSAAGIGGRCDGIVTINGGFVEATSGSNAAAIGGGNAFDGTVTINGGVVEANGNNYAACIGGGRLGSGTVYVNGGQIEAQYGNFGFGGGDTTTTGTSVIHLNWTSRTDSIYSVGYNGSLYFDNNFTDGTNNYLTSDLAYSDNTELEGLTLTPLLTSLKNINFASMSHGTASASPVRAYPGERVYLSYTPDEGYAFHSVTVTDSNNNSVTVTDNKYFKMPSGNVIVTVAFTEQANTYYIDLNGDVQEVHATEITSATTQLTDGWYVVNGEVSKPGQYDSERILATGNVNLILADGATLTLPCGIGFSSNGGSLTIWEQSEKTGKLIVTSVSQFDNQYNAGIGSNYGDAVTHYECNVIINGGNLDITGGDRGAAIGGAMDTKGHVTINGGNITATGGLGGAAIGGGSTGSGDITINGGNIDATGGDYAAGIGSGAYASETALVKIYDGTIISDATYGGCGIGGGNNTKADVRVYGGNIVTYRSGTTYSNNSNKPNAGIGGGRGTAVANSTVLMTYTDDIYLETTFYGTVNFVKAFSDFDFNTYEGQVEFNSESYSTYTYSKIYIPYNTGRVIANVIGDHGVIFEKSIETYKKIGQNVYFEMSADLGYTIDTLTVKDSNGNDVPFILEQFDDYHSHYDEEIDDFIHYVYYMYSFSMPDTNVTITASFKKKDLTINYVSVKGTFTSQSTAQYGDEVTLSYTPEAGYGLDRYYVIDAHNNAITVTNGKFTMPFSDVTVYAGLDNYAFVDAAEPYIDENGAYILGNYAYYTDGYSCFYVNTDGSVGNMVINKSNLIYSHFTFEEGVSGQTYKIKKYTGPVDNLTELVIPKTYNGKPVTTLSDGFDSSTPLLDNQTVQFELVLNENIEYIGLNAFKNLGVTNVTGDTSGLQEIASNAFQNANPNANNVVIFNLDYNGTVSFRKNSLLNVNAVINLKHCTNINYYDANQASVVYNFTDPHTYGEPVWEWSDNFDSVTATFVCSHNLCGHEETLNAVVTHSDNAGIRTYTATVEMNGVTYTDTIEQDTSIYDINEDGVMDVNDIGFIISASAGLVTMTASQEAKADLNGDGVVDAFDAAELDRIMFSVNTAKGDVNQDGEVNEVDYAMVKSYVECTNDLLSTDYLESRYDTLKTQYPEGTIITQQYYCADYDCDKAVDAFDLFYLDKRINNLI